MKKVYFILSAFCFVGLFVSCEVENIDNDYKTTKELIQTRSESDQDPIIQTFPTVVEDRKYTYTQGSGWHCGISVGNVCTYSPAIGWHIVNVNDEGIALEEGTVTSFINVSVYNDLVKIEVQQYSDEWMHEVNENAFNLKESKYLKLSNEEGDLLEISGISTIKLQAGTYELVPTKGNIGTYYIDAEVTLQ